jgi:CBS-domain-containing membrane protein
MSKKASDLMSGDPACITRDTSAQEAARLMESRDVGSLPVVESQDSKRLVGIVTDRDLALKILGADRPASTPVGEVMSSGLRTAGPDDSLDEVEELMAEHQVRRIPVVDDRGQILGVIAQADLARERRAVGDKDFAKVVERISDPSGSR